jgi:hypothetical protein
MRHRFPRRLDFYDRERTPWWHFSPVYCHPTLESPELILECEGGLICVSGMEITLSSPFGGPCRAVAFGMALRVAVDPVARTTLALYSVLIT